MRKAFVKTLTALAQKDPNLMLVTGDLGFNALEEFKDTVPKQYLNAGIMEQTMIGVCAGLAMSGKRIFAYSIIPFATYRCYEQIRDDVCYHNLPVCIVGVGAGYSYDRMGSTHHALEDIAVMRALPNMTVVCPGDPLEVDAAVRAIAKHDGPCYLRLAKAGEPDLHSVPLGDSFVLGEAITMREGTDIALLATGNMLETGMKVADVLKEKGFSVRLLSVPTVKPLDQSAVLSAVLETKLVVSLEEHSHIGGLGSAIAEVLSPLAKRAPHLILSAPDAFSKTVGVQSYLRDIAGLSPAKIVASIEGAMADL
jgi:transketolase